MGVLQIKVIMHSINIGRHNTGKRTSIRILLMVCPVKKKIINLSINCIVGFSACKLKGNLGARLGMQHLIVPF